MAQACARLCHQRRHLLNDVGGNLVNLVNSPLSLIIIMSLDLFLYAASLLVAILIASNSANPSQSAKVNSQVKSMMTTWK